MRGGIRVFTFYILHIQPLLMAETGVWAPCESPVHAASTVSSTVDADLMVTDGDRVVVDKKLSSAVWYLRLPPKKIAPAAHTAQSC